MCAVAELIISVCRAVCFCFLTLVCYLFPLSSGPLTLCGKWTSQPMLFLSHGSFGAFLISVSVGKMMMGMMMMEDGVGGTSLGELLDFIPFEASWKWILSQPGNSKAPQGSPLIYWDQIKEGQNVLVLACLVIISSSWYHIQISRIIRCLIGQAWSNQFTSH